MGEGSPDSLIGRDDAIRAVATAIAAERPLVVIGEAGIGKTSVIRAAVEGSGRRLREGGGFATLQWLPYLALRRALGSAVEGDHAHVAARVERLVGPDVLFVDDLQWTDRDTRAVLALLVERLQLVCAIRSGDEAAADVDRLISPWRPARLELDALDGPAATSLVRRLRPDLPASVIARLVARAAGNPLVLEELALRGGPSPLVAGSLAARLTRLPVAARATVRMLAIADEPIERTRLSHVDRGVRDGLLLERDGRVTLRHAILAESIRADLTPRQRRRLHERLAALAADPALAARHLAQAGRREDAARVAAAALTAASAPSVRAMLLAIAAEADGARVTLGPRLEAARALGELSDWPGVERLLAPEPADATAEERVERLALLAEAAYGDGRLAAARTRIEQCRAIPVPGGTDAAAARVLVAARFAVNVDGAVAAALAGIEEELVHASGHSRGREELVTLREAILALATGQGDLERLRRASLEAVAAGRYRTGADLARVVQYAMLMHVGARAALEWLGAARRAFADAEAAGAALEFAAEAVHTLLLEGRLADAIAAADALLEQPAPVRVHQLAAILRARALVHLGELETAALGLVGVSATLTDDYFGAGEWHLAQAELAMWSGLLGRAEEEAHAALTVRAPVAGGEVQATLARDWARLDAGRPLDPPHDPPPMRSLAGAAAEARGIRLRAAGEHDAAGAAFREAADLWAGFNVPKELLCRWADGDSLRLAGAPDAARERLGSALIRCTALGFVPLAARIRRSLRMMGVRLPTPRRDGGLLEQRLTGREREIVALVERGLTNVEIARRLGLGRPTVARTLASAMGKLGTDRRTQLAVHGSPR